MGIKYKENYPNQWDEIAALIKQSNLYICQMCGQQCVRPGEPYDRRRILTVAHLFHDYTGAEIFVAAICVLCHFDYDRGLGQRFRRRNERWRRSRAGQLELIRAGWAPGLVQSRSDLTPDDLAEMVAAWPSLDELFAEATLT